MFEFEMFVSDTRSSVIDSIAKKINAHWTEVCLFCVDKNVDKYDFSRSLESKDCSSSILKDFKKWRRDVLLKNLDSKGLHCSIYKILLANELCNKKDKNEENLNLIRSVVDDEVKKGVPPSHADFIKVSSDAGSAFNVFKTLNIHAPNLANKDKGDVIKAALRDSALIRDSSTSGNSTAPDAETTSAPLSNIRVPSLFFTIVYVVEAITALVAISFIISISNHEPDPVFKLFLRTCAVIGVPFIYLTVFLITRAIADLVEE